MGRRKPPLPRRRIGLQYVEVTPRRHGPTPSSAPAVGASSAVSAPSSASLSVSAQTSAPPPARRPPSASLPPPATGTTTDDNASAPVVPSTPPTIMATAIASRDGTAPGARLAPSSVRMATIPLRPTGAVSAAVAATAATTNAVKTPTTTTSATLSNGTRPDSDDSITVSIAELEAWRRQTMLEIEEHYTNEQLKRIAEFGRVHANLVREAREYVASIEGQLKEQFERERASLRAQAEAYVSGFQAENAALRHQLELAQAAIESLQRETPTTATSVESLPSSDASSRLSSPERREIATLVPADKTTTIPPLAIGATTAVVHVNGHAAPR